MKTISCSFIVDSSFVQMKRLSILFFVLIGCHQLTAQSMASVDVNGPVTEIEQTSEEALSLSVLPNPTSEVLVVETKNNMIQRLEFYDLAGIKVQEATIDNAQKVTLNLHSLEDGTYLLKLITVKGVLTKHFTKQ